ncbi:MAG: ATP-binding protein [Desulfobaccales bacterium]
MTGNDSTIFFEKSILNSSAPPGAPEDRKLFKQLLAKLDLKQPPNDTATCVDHALAIARDVTYPVLVRPSYVLGGRAMQIVYNDAELVKFMKWALEASPDHPILIDKLQTVHKVREKRPHIIDRIRNQEISLLINTPGAHESRGEVNSIRRVALEYNIPYATTMAAAWATLDAIRALKQRDSQCRVCRSIMKWWLPVSSKCR